LYQGTNFSRAGKAFIFVLLERASARERFAFPASSAACLAAEVNKKYFTSGAEARSGNDSL
jgi:hypothetical protein